MNATFELNELSRIVPGLTKITNGRILSLLGMLKFTCESNGYGTITGSDGNVWVTRSITGVDVPSDMEFLIRANDLAPILKLKDQAISMELDFEKTSAVVKWKGGKIRCGLQETEDYPQPSNSKTDFECEIKHDALVESLSKVINATDSSDKIGVKQGVNMSSASGSLVFVATDTHRLHIVASDHDGESFNITLPGSLVKILMELDGNSPFSFEWSKDANSLTITHGSDVIAGSLLACAYPNWRRVIPDSFSHKASIVSGDLVAAIKRLMMCEPNAYRTIFTFNENTINVFGSNLDGRDYSEDLECASDYPDGYQFCANGNYVVDSINSCGSNNVSLEGISATRPISITDTDGSGFQAIIMPMAL